MNYKHGHPFSEPLPANLDDIKHRVRGLHKAGVIVIEGGLGEGKTTLGVECADYITGKNISLKEQYAFGGIAFQEKIQICHALNLPAIIYDESGDFSKRGSLTDFNRRLVRVFETFRAYNTVVILILPSVSMIDESLFNLKVIRMVINCYRRTNKQGNFRAYSLYRTMLIKDYMKKNVIKEYAYTKIQPNFRGHFLNLDKARADELEKISMEGKLNILSDNILKAKGLLSTKDMAYRLKMSQAWVKKKILDLNIKPAQIHKKHKYYDAEVLPNLESLIKYKK